MVINCAAEAERKSERIEIITGEEVQRLLRGFQTLSEPQLRSYIREWDEGRNISNIPSCGYLSEEDLQSVEMLLVNLNGAVIPVCEFSLYPS